MRYIIVIDDSVTIRSSVELALRGLAFGIRHAQNGMEALKKIKDMKNTGDALVLCIVDVNMPVMNGITFVKKLRETDKFIPILMLTTESGQSKIKEGKEAGASGWLIKPFRSEELIGAISRLVRSSI